MNKEYVKVVKSGSYAGIPYNKGDVLEVDYIFNQGNIVKTKNGATISLTVNKDYGVEGIILKNKSCNYELWD